jgi:hypothetical protein
MSKPPKLWPAKIGSIPGVVVLRGGSRPTVGRMITFRRPGAGERWRMGKVDAIRYGNELVIDLL